MYRREKRKHKATQERLRSIKEHIDNLRDSMPEIEVKLKEDPILKWHCFDCGAEFEATVPYWRAICPYCGSENVKEVRTSK